VEEIDSLIEQKVRERFENITDGKDQL